MFRSRYRLFRTFGLNLFFCPYRFFRNVRSGKLTQVSRSPPLCKDEDTMSRREQIEAMLADDPQDTFLRYSLAMEYRSEGRHEESLAKLAELYGETPSYVPAFFMAGQQLVQLKQIDQARAVLREGIDEARRQNDQHAAAEMSELLSAIGRFGEITADAEAAADEEDDL